MLDLTAGHIVGKYRKKLGRKYLVPIFHFYRDRYGLPGDASDRGLVFYSNFVPGFQLS